VTTPIATTPNPVILGPDADFDALRVALASAGYFERAVCERCCIQKISQFDLDRNERDRNELKDAGKDSSKDPGSDALGLLIRLMLQGERLPRDLASQAAGPTLSALSKLGLLVADPLDATRVAATVVLYPMRDLWIVSDRPNPLLGKPARPFEDFVYPALVPTTDLFLDLIPGGPCDAFLDVCSGTGIAALVAARAGAAHAYAFDITERSTHFAEFNRRLNGIANFTAAQGDLYEPAGAQTFDRIVAHPPYVPVARPQLIFDSGGQDGEQVTRRIIEELPRVLRPGGCFYALTMGSDRQQPFERRIREWLGAGEADFDVALVGRRILTPREWTAEWVVRYHGSGADVPAWRAFLRELGVQSLVYGWVMIQRRKIVGQAHSRPVFTVRRQAGAKTTPADHAWLLEWETAAAGLPKDWLQTVRPRASPNARLRVEHRMTSDGWVPDSYTLEVESPFDMESRAQAWTAQLLASADGVRTAAQLLDELKSEGALHPDAPAADFAQVLSTLISGGFLIIS
jgi:SAM-dependent methyltransferase